MKIKSHITGIIILILFIIIVSTIIISIKDLMNKNDLDDMDITDIAGTLNDYSSDNNNETSSANPIILDAPNNDIAISQGAIAVVDIPSVGIRGQVVEGTDDATLKNYIGKFKGCAYPGENGNFCVAAHNNIYTEIFRELHNVKVGEELRVVTKEKIYTYKVTSVTKIAPTQIEVLNADMSKKEITLITCTNMGRERISVKGELIKEESV